MFSWYQFQRTSSSQTADDLYNPDVIRTQNVASKKPHCRDTASDTEYTGWEQIKNSAALVPCHSVSRKELKSCQQLIKDVPVAGRDKPVIMQQLGTKNAYYSPGETNSALHSFVSKLWYAACNRPECGRHCIGILFEFSVFTTTKNQRKNSEV